MGIVTGLEKVGFDSPEVTEKIMVLPASINGSSKLLSTFSEAPEQLMGDPLISQLRAEEITNCDFGTCSSI